MGAGRKQAIHRRELNTKRNAARARFRARYPDGYSAARPEQKPINPIMRVIGFLFAATVGLLIVAFLLHNQIEIARVMASGRPAQATIVSVSCQRSSRSETGGVTVRFTDLHGVSHTVAHTRDDLGCYDGYAVGGVITIRYVPDDPMALLTQQEIDDLPPSLLLYALVDILFIVGPTALALYFGIPWARRRWESRRVAAESGASSQGAH